MLSAAEVSLNALNKQAQLATNLTKVVDSHRSLIVDDHKTAFAY
jgi:hypothetical protein